MLLPRLYRRLISLYPADYRNEYGEEMAWVFEQAHGDKALTWKMLGISRATLYRKLKRYNIPLKGDDGEAELKPPS